MCKSLEIFKGNEFNVTINSLNLVKIFNKRHADIMRDIKNESSKIGKEAERIFALSEYEDKTGRKLPCYELNEEGLLQLGARYNAEIRRKLIKKLYEYKNYIHEKEMGELKEDIKFLADKVDNQMTIDHGKQRLIQRAVAKRVFERTFTVSGIENKYKNGLDFINTKKAIDLLKEWNKKNGRKFYSSLYRDIKNRFAVTSYRDIKIKDFEYAINYIENWIESQELREEVQ